MNMKHRIQVIALLGAAALLTSTHPSLADQARRPNIVFIIADDMYRDMLNCTPEGKGRNVTPTLDRLAAEGVVMQGQHIVSPRLHAQPLQLPHRPVREPRAQRRLYTDDRARRHEPGGVEHPAAGR